VNQKKYFNLKEKKTRVPSLHDFEVLLLKRGFKNFF